MEIKLESYFYTNRLWYFYQFSKNALSDPASLQKLVESQRKEFLELGLEYLQPNASPEAFAGIAEEAMPNQVNGIIQDGLPMLRNQLLVAGFSNFESFLCHVLRIYLHTFPQLLKNVDRKLDYKKIVDLKDDHAIFRHIVESEINSFSYKGLQEKRDYFIKKLKLSSDPWVYDGIEFWREIDKTRNAIVHGENPPTIDDDFLLKSLNFMSRAMLTISVYSQKDHGIPFQWGTEVRLDTYFKRKSEPKL